MRYGQYFEPTPLLRELHLLECLEVTPNLSQSALAKQVGLTPAMVNAYIRRFQTEGLLTTAELSRGLAYHLTAKGVQRLNYHRVTYRAELVQTIRAARLLFQEYFQKVAHDGIRTVVLYGAGETADVTLDALEGTAIIQVLAVIDDDAAKHGGSMRGIPIRGVDAVAHLAPDAIVITSVTYGEQIRERIECSTGPACRVYSLTQ